LLLSRSYYHVITRGNNRMVIFNNDEDYRYYLQLVNRFKKELPFDLYHYCLMPNHIHFQIRTDKAENFSMFIKKLNLAYFYHFKKNQPWIGHIWQDRFRSQPIGKDEYFIQCGKYIELNPVRAGITKNPKAYIYSSYNFYASGKRDDLLTEDLFYQSLGKTDKGRQTEYVDLVVSSLVLESYKRPVWGSGRQRYNEKRKINYHTILK